MPRPCAGRLALAGFLVGWMLTAGAGRAMAQDAQADDEAAIRALIVQFYQAYASGDPASIKSLWSARVPGLDRLMAAFEPTIRGKSFTFANLAASRIEVQSIIASARVTLDAAITEAATKKTSTEKWVRAFTVVKDPEGWRVWRDASAAEDVAIEIAGAGSADRAAAIVEREPDLMTGEVSQALFSLGNRFASAGRSEEAQAVHRLSERVASRSGQTAVLAASNTNMGVACQVRGNYDCALDYFQRALGLYERLDDRPHVARSESNVGSVFYLKQRYGEATEHYRRALALFEQIEDKVSMASTLHSLGNAAYLANDFTAAIEHYRRSLALHDAMPGGVIGAANALQAIGLVQTEQGDYEAALESYTASLARHEKYGNTAGIGIVRASLGDVHRLMGSYAVALECYFAALPLLVETGDKVTQPATLSHIAGVYAAERRYTQALDYYAKALAIYETTKSPAEVARVVAGEGAVYFSQGKHALAMDRYERSLRLFQEIESSAGVAWTLVHMGLVHQADSRFTEADAAYEKSLAIVEGLNDKASIAVTLALMARSRASLDRPHEGLAAARQAAMVATGIGELDTLARARLVAGEIDMQLEDAAGARQAFADAVTALEQLQMEGAAAERDRFFGDTLAPFLGLVRLSIADGRPEEALGWLERGKASLLRNIIGGTGTLVTKGMTDAERADERALARRLVSLATQLKRERGREVPDQARMERLQADLDMARANRAAFTSALYEAHPNLKALRVQGQPRAIGGAGGLVLPASSAVLEFAVGEKSTFVFLVKPGAGLKPRATRDTPANLGRGLSPAEGSAEPLPDLVVKAGEIDVKATELAAKIVQFRSLILKKDAGADRLGRELYDLLLKPMEREMAAATRLVVVPDAVLWALPFQALGPRDGRYLIEDRAVSVAPSLASFVEMSQQGRRPARQTAAALTAIAFGLAAPGNATLERLAHLRPDVKVEAQPEAPKEAAAVARLYGPARGKAFVGDAATRARFAAEAPGAGVLHVAAPGVLDDSSPMVSEIAFAAAAPDDTNDALVETWQLMGLDVSADVAVFSRLYGEPGQARAGEAAVGLAWAMFTAGTPTTVLTSWVVDAPSTSSLALAFHRRAGAAGPPSTGSSSAAEALRRATLGLLAAPATRHPYFWAGFSVIGR